MKRYFLIAIVGCLTVLLANGCSAPEESAEVLLNQAVKKATAGDWKNADILAGKILKINKNDVNALLLRAMARYNLDSRASALDCALRAAELAPKLFIAQYLKGMLLYNEGKYELAMPALRAARSLNPSDLNTVILLAKSAYNLKKYDVAAGYYVILAKSPQYRGTAFPLNGIGACLAHRNPHKALAFFRAAQKVTPNDMILALNLAVLYDRYLNQKADSLAFYEYFIQKTTGKPEYDSVRIKAELRLDSLKSR